MTWSNPSLLHLLRWKLLGLKLKETLLRCKKWACHRKVDFKIYELAGEEFINSLWNSWGIGFRKEFHSNTPRKLPGYRCRCLWNVSVYCTNRQENFDTVRFSIRFNHPLMWLVTGLDFSGWQEFTPCYARFDSDRLPVLVSIQTCKIFCSCGTRSPHCKGACFKQSGKIVLQPGLFRLNYSAFYTISRDEH